MQTIPTIAGGLSIAKTAVEIAAGNNPLQASTPPKVDRKRIACGAFSTVSYSYVKGDPTKTDTAETIRQVRRHNAAYRALKCPPKAKR